MADTTTEYQVWYDAVDGARRMSRSLDKPGVQQIISELNADEQRRQLTAASVGLSVPPHQYNFSAELVTSTTEQVDLDSLTSGS